MINHLKYHIRESGGTTDEAIVMIVEEQPLVNYISNLNKIIMNQQITKICTKSNCIHFGNPQPLDNFHKDETHSDGYRSFCKDCVKLYRKQYNFKNQKTIKEKNKTYYNNNKEKILETQREYYKENAENIILRTKLYSIKNQDTRLQYLRKYRNAFVKYDTYFKKLEKYDECRQDPENTDLLQVRCTYCNRWFNPTNIDINNRILAISNLLKGENRLYCSNGCKSACPIFGRKMSEKKF